MFQQKSSKHLFVVFICLIPVFYMAAMWQRIPNEVATHFDLSGRPNDYTNKSYLWLMSALALLVYFILQYTGKIDPKRLNKTSNFSITRLGFVVVIFLTALNLLVVMASIYPGKNLVSLAMLPLVGLMFTFLGNYMYNIKPNYFAGFKLPWTLASDYNWRKTHQVAGRLWFFGGLTLTIVSLFIHAKIAQTLFNVLIGIMVIVPIAYSFLLFKKEGSDPKYFERENKGSING